MVRVNGNHVDKSFSRETMEIEGIARLTGRALANYGPFLGSCNRLVKAMSIALPVHGSPRGTEFRHGLPSQIHNPREQKNIENYENTQ